MFSVANQFTPFDSHRIITSLESFGMQSDGSSSIAVTSIRQDASDILSSRRVDWLINQKGVFTLGKNRPVSSSVQVFADYDGDTLPDINSADKGVLTSQRGQLSGFAAGNAIARWNGCEIAGIAVGKLQANTYSLASDIAVARICPLHGSADAMELSIVPLLNVRGTSVSLIPAESGRADIAKFQVSVSPLSGTGVPDGTVTVAAGSLTPQTLPLLKGETSFSTPIPDQETDIQAVYSASDKFAASWKTATLQPYGAASNSATSASGSPAAVSPIGAMGVKSQAISKKPSAPIITTIAGNGTSGNNGDGGPATQAAIVAAAVAVDSHGNAYFVDSTNCVVRKVAISTSTISTVAGTGTCGHAGDGSSAISAQIQPTPYVTIDPQNNIFFGESAGYIREVSASTGVITTIAGTGQLGYSGDGGPATAAEMWTPSGIVADQSGNVFVAGQSYDPKAKQYFGSIRQIDMKDGLIITIAGNASLTGSPVSGENATANSLNSISGLGVDPNENIYYAAPNENYVWQVSLATGKINIFAGTGAQGYAGDGNDASLATFNQPWSVSVDGSRNVLIVDRGNSVIRSVSSIGNIVTTIAGTGVAGFSGDDAAATSAKLSQPQGAAADSSGKVLVADFANNRLRSISATSLNGLNPANLQTPGFSASWTSPVPSGGGGYLGATVSDQGGLCSSSYGGAPIQWSGGISLTSSQNCWPDSCNIPFSTQMGQAAGTWGVTATYHSNQYCNSRSYSGTITVTKVTPTVTVSCPTPIAYGLSNTCNVTVTNNASGTVTMSNNGIVWTTGTLTDTGTFGTWSGGGWGGWPPVVVTVKALYNGDSANNGGVSGQTTFQIVKATPTVTLSCTPTTLTYGTTTTACTASVSTSGTGAAPSGTVSFNYTGSSSGPWTSCVLSGGSCGLSGGFLNAPGGASYTVTATYNGDTNYNGGVISNGVGITIVKATPTGSISCSPNPVTYYTVMSTCTGTVSKSPTGVYPTGSLVMYWQDLTPIGANNTWGFPGLNASAQGSLSGFSTMDVGTYLIQGTYGGDSNYNNIVLTSTNVGITKATPTCSFPSGSSINYTQALSSSALSGGSCTWPNTGSIPGSFAFNSPGTTPSAGASQCFPATWNPSNTTDYSPVVGSICLSVNKAQSTITTLPTASATTYGAVLSTSALSGGAGNPAGGSFSWTAPSTVVLATPSVPESVTYTPVDTVNWLSATGTVNVPINKANPNALLSSSSNPSSYGQSVTFSISLTGVAGGATPSGSVTFQYNSTTVLCSAISVSAGTASCTTSSLPAGSDAITAAYSGDINYNSGTWGLTQNVIRANPGVFSATCTPNPVNQGANYACTVGLSSSATGTVTWPAVFGGATTAVSGGASSTGTLVASAAPGTYTGSVTYNGDSNFNPSTLSLTLVVAANTSVSCTPISTLGQNTTCTASVSAADGYVTFYSPTTLTGEWWNGSYPTAGGRLSSAPAAITHDSYLNYNVTGYAWGQAPPAGVNTTTIYARWTGSFVSTIGGTYTIGVNSDDGANVYVNGTPLVSNLVNAQGAQSNLTYSQSGTISLSAGATNSIVVEYQQGGGGAGIQLLWTPPGQSSPSLLGWSIVPANGSKQASISGPMMNPGTSTITAVWTGDSTYSGSTGTTTLNAPNGTAVNVFSNLNPSNYGQTVAFTSVVSTGGVTPAGSATFADAGSQIGSGSVAAVSTFNILPLSNSFGSWSINAATLGAGAQPDPMGGATAQQLTMQTGSNNSEIYYTINQNLGSVASRTFTASGWFYAPAGGPIPYLRVEECSTPWNGFTSSAATTGGWVRITATGTFLSTDTQSCLNFIVRNNTTNAGTITLYGLQLEEAGSVGPYVLTDAAPRAGFGGIATFSTASLSGGAHSITSVASGVTSPILTQVVNSAPSTTSINCTPNPAAYQQTLNCTATVSGDFGGTIALTINGLSWTSGAPNGSGSFSASRTVGIGSGSYTVVANYSGDTAYGASSASVTVTAKPATTTDTLTSSANPSTYGPITFTNTTSAVSGGATPTGTVAFVDTTTSTTLCASAAVSAGVATCTTSTLAPGSHTIVATYGGDTNYSSLTASITQAVSKGPSIATCPSATSLTYGQTLASVTLSGGTGSPAGGTFAWTSPTNATTVPPAGTDVYGMTYTPTDATDYNTSSCNVTVTVAKATPTVTPVSSANPATYPGSVTFNVTMAATGSGVAPTGSVTFKDNTTTICNAAALSGGLATCAPPTLTAGSHPISATYSGDTNYNTASGSLTQTVNTGSPTVNLSSSSNPSTYAAAVTLTATVPALGSGATPTGTVTFKDGATTVCAAVAMSSGSATCLTSALTAGLHSLTAAYSGDTNYGTATGSLSQTVNKANSSIPTCPSASAITYGRLLSASTLSGGVGSPAGGAFTWTNASLVLNAGSQTPSVTYNPADAADYNTSTCTPTVTVKKALPTEALISSLPTGSVYTNPVTFTASLPAVGSGVYPTGTVSFTNGATALCTAVALGSGSGSCPGITTLAVGVQPITAVYSGDANYLTATASLTQTVSAQGAIITTLPTAGPLTYGQTLASSSLTGGVGSPAPGAFTYASPPTTVPRAGTDPEGIVYTPKDGNYTPASGTVNLTVAKATPTVGLATSLSPSTYPNSVTFTATLPASGGGVQPTGTIAFTDTTTSATLCASAAVSGGVATCSVASLTAGSHSIKATYSGDSNYATAFGTFAQTVNPGNATIPTSPTPSPITYGQTLASSTLTGGVGSPAGGTFAWTTPSTVPPAGSPTEGITY